MSVATGPLEAHAAREHPEEQQEEPGDNFPHRHDRHRPYRPYPQMVWCEVNCKWRRPGYTMWDAALRRWRFSFLARCSTSSLIDSLLNVAIPRGDAAWQGRGRSRRAFLLVKCRGRRAARTPGMTTKTSCTETGFPDVPPFLQMEHTPEPCTVDNSHSCSTSPPPGRGQPTRDGEWIRNRRGSAGQVTECGEKHRGSPCSTATLYCAAKEPWPA